MKSSSRKKGFTLIEILVVISIIGLLASVMLAALNSAKVSGQDASRQETVWEINNAIQLYMAAHGNQAPTLNGACGANNTTLNSSNVWTCMPTSYDNSSTDNNQAWTAFMNDLAPYISLPPASCSSSCSSSPAIGYVYVSPAAMYYYCGGNLFHCNNDNVDLTQYQVYVKLFSGKEIGVKTSGQIFYDPLAYYLQTVVSINGGSSVSDPKYNNGCTMELTTADGLGNSGTGACISTRLLTVPDTYSSYYYSGCPQNPDSDVPPTSCSVSSYTIPILPNSPGLYQATLNVTEP